MLTYWHFIFYTVYRAERRLHILFTKLNPIFSLYKIPRFEAYCVKKHGRKPIEVYNEAFLNKRWGLSLRYTMGFMTALLFCLVAFIFNITVMIFDIKDVFTAFSWVWIALVTSVINLFFLLRTEKYLDAFARFDQMEKLKKRGYYILSLGFSFVVMIGFVYTLFYVGVYFRIDS